MKPIVNLDLKDELKTVKVYSLFNKSGVMQELTDTDLKIGQIIWLNGYGQDKYSHERKAIYEANKSGFDGRVQYKYVNLDKPGKGIESAYHIKPESEIFGIGIYYTPGDFATPEQIQGALMKADKKEAEDKLSANAAAEIRARDTEQGCKIFEENKPQGAVAVIVAEFKVDESDPMTDYFNSSTQKTIILAFSNHTRDLFSEMRKAAANCDIPEINQLKDAPPEYENREKWSMGAGYYLGKSKYSGWLIRKQSLKWGLSDLYLTAGRGGFYAYKTKAKAPDETIKTGNLTLVDYSEKALALFGDTKPLKEALKELGGRFNFALTFEGQRAPGWVFSKSKRPELENLINEHK